MRMTWSLRREGNDLLSPPQTPPVPGDRHSSVSEPLEHVAGTASTHHYYTSVQTAQVCNGHTVHIILPPKLSTDTHVYIRHVCIHNTYTHMYRYVHTHAYIHVYIHVSIHTDIM